MTNHDVWDAVAQSDGTPGNSFEFLLAIQANRVGPYVQTADINNVNPAFSGKTRMRQTYGAKGNDLANTYARNLVMTFDVEVVRDENGAFQPELQDLLVAARSLNEANRRRIQAYDALGADYAFQADFAIEHNRTNTGWDDASFFTFTATQFTPHEWIDNPTLDGLVPIVSAANPTAAEEADEVYIEGSRFFLDGVADVVGAAGVKFGGVNATSYTVVSDSLIVAVVPAGSAGAANILVTNSAGGSTLAYIRGA